MIVSSERAAEVLREPVSVCIVGAGAAGITLACELDGLGHRVLLLEAGGFALDVAQSSEWYRGSVQGTHPDPAEYRRTGFGGTTAIWGGRCVPYDPIDFERRDWVPGSGWPIAYNEIAQHYPRALDYCEAGANDFTVSGSLVGGNPTLPGLAPDDPSLLDRIERYSLPTNFGVSHRERLERSQNITVLLHARCVNLIRDPAAERIAALEFVDRAGAPHRVEAQHIVLAAGGIETVRLMLNSEPDGPGLGNAHDLLGRHYMCHFDNICARLVTDGAQAAFAFERTRDGVYARRKLQFSVDAQRTQRLLNSAFRLHFPEYSDASHRSGVLSAIYLAKSVLIKEYRQILQHGAQQAVASPALQHVRNVLFDVPGIVRFAWTWLFGIVLAKRKLPYTLIANADGSYPIEFNSEQLPRANNRVRLTDERDRDGLRRVEVSWSLDDDEIDAALRAFLELREAVARTAHCRVEFDEAQLRAQLARSVPVGGHHIGTARMGASAREGVVDSNCTVFGLDNLHLASAAVFPTSSHANPTLTIVALAIRLAAHLRSKIDPARPASAH